MTKTNALRRNPRRAGTKKDAGKNLASTKNKVINEEEEQLAVQTLAYLHDDLRSNPTMQSKDQQSSAAPLTYAEQEEVAAALANLSDHLLSQVEALLIRARVIGSDEEDVDIDMNELSIIDQRSLQQLVVTGTSRNGTSRNGTSRNSVKDALTYEEQASLTIAINNLSEDLLPGAVDIILGRTEGKANDDDKDGIELSLELDELETVTQRKLQQYVARNNANAKPRRVSDITDMSDSDESITRAEYNELFVMLQNVQHEVSLLQEEFLR